MTKGAKLGLIFGIGAAVAAASYYFLVYKPAQPKDNKKDDTDAINAALLAAANGNTGTPVPSWVITPAPVSPSVNPLIGKKMYSIMDGLNIRRVSDGSLAKTLNKGAFVGIVDGQLTVASSPFLTFANSFYRVPKGAVRLA